MHNKCRATELKIKRQGINPCHTQRTRRAPSPPQGEGFKK